MKAISVYQPWASLIAHGLKTMFTVSRRVRKPFDDLAIHSMNSWDKRGIAFCERPELRRALRKMGYADYTKMPLGHILATTVFCGNVQRVDLSEAETDDYMTYGDLKPARWIWRVKEAMLLSEPFFFTGRPALFDVPDEMLKAAMTATYPTA